MKHSHLLRNAISADLGNNFRSAMARVSAQAMILTAGSKNTTSGLHGMTVSSVCSLSVHPTPLLLFNLHLPSYTSKTLHENNGVLGLHVMPPSQTSVMLGRKFAGGVKRYVPNSDTAGINSDEPHEMTTPFDGLAKSFTMHETESGVSIPVLNELEAVFICTKHRVFSVDNHELWVVRVNDILYPNMSSSASSGGLLYYQKGFHQIGQPLTESRDS